MSLRGTVNRYHVGETIRLRAKATDPETLAVLTPTSAVVEWWGPGVDRTASLPAVTSNMGWRVTEQDFVLYQATDGWPPGRWTYKVSVTGTQYTNVSVGAITLNP